MDTLNRAAFNRAYSPDLFARYRTMLEREVGPVPFRLAETPLFMDAPLRTELARSASEICDQLSQPELLWELRKAIPAHYQVPGMDPLPNCVQVDFALCPGPNGRLTGKLIEMQAFPSLYALMDYKAQAWARVFEDVPGLQGHAWTPYLDTPRSHAVDLMRRTVLGGEDPEQVVLVDITPDLQKTKPDFVATQLLMGVDSVCVTKLIKRGDRLFRHKDGREVPVRRIYNRLVFDELERKNVQVPFGWTDDLDVSWCSHPNWYWVWSKLVLPHLNHAAVPRTTYLSALKDIPADLHNFVLKPLFSFAGTGVVIDVTPADIERIPTWQRDGWVLQEKVTYAHALPMPDGTGVKAEIRVMLMRAPADTALKPLQMLVRLSRGKMIGVDHNKDLAWTGGTVALW